MSTTYYHPFLKLWGVLSESKRIIIAHFRHFLALSVLFLLPLSISPIINRFIAQQSPDFFSHPTKTEVLLRFLFYLFSLVLSLVAYSTITYSTFNGFYCKPFNLTSSFKSVLYSFLPLLLTFFFYQIIIFLFFFSFAFAVILVDVVCLLVFGFGFDLQSNMNYVMGFVLLLGIVGFVGLIWLQVNWSLWAVIVVLESKRGYAPLKRSRYLVNGMRGVALSFQLVYGSTIGLFVWGSYTGVVKVGWFISWVLSSVFIPMFMLLYLVANVVLYLHCKALHGELDLEIAEKFATNKYVSLPIDCEMVPSHVVQV